MHASQAPGAQARLDSIDALRGLAALLVAGYHVWGHYGLYPFPSLGVVPQTETGGLFSYLVSPLRWGYLGVSLFLVLSGFCIHLPFARRRYRATAEGDPYRLEPREFFLRRLWRLYPAYLVSVVGTFLLLVVTSRFIHYPPEGAPDLGDLLTHLTFTHGFFDQYFYGIVSVYWSLALEVQLYIAYPLFLMLFRKMGATRAVLMLTVVSLAWRVLALTVCHHSLISIAWTGPYTLMGCVLARMPEWLFGAWLAEQYAAAVGSISWKRAPLLVAGSGLLVVAMASTLSEALWSVVDPLFGIAFALLVAAAIAPSHTGTVEKEGGAAYRWLVRVGMISYSVYLFHLQLSWFANVYIQRVSGDVLPFGLRLLVLALSVPIVGWLYRLVEAPFLRAPSKGMRTYPAYQALRRAMGLVGRA